MIIDVGEDMYDLPESWEDITFNEFLELNKLSEKAPKENATEKAKLKFYIDYISYFGIPKEQLKKVKLTTEVPNELGIINLFNHLWQFTNMPINPEFKEFNSFIIGKQLYLFNKQSLDLTGGFKPMNEYTFEEYEEANGIMNAMVKLKENNLDCLSLLCAIFFRPVKTNFFGMYFGKPVMEAYNEETVNERAELFKHQLSMDKVFSAYFFLLNQIAGFAKDTADSLLKEVQKNLS